jgi:hypothetical protein
MATTHWKGRQTLWCVHVILQYMDDGNATTIGGRGRS